MATLKTPSQLQHLDLRNGPNYKLECALPATTVGILDTQHRSLSTWDGVTQTLFVNEVASEAPGNGGPGETEDRPLLLGITPWRE